MTSECKLCSRLSSLSLNLERFCFGLWANGARQKCLHSEPFCCTKVLAGFCGIRGIYRLSSTGTLLRHRLQPVSFYGFRCCLTRTTVGSRVLLTRFAATPCGASNSGESSLVLASSNSLPDFAVRPFVLTSVRNVSGTSSFAFREKNSSEFGIIVLEPGEVPGGFRGPFRPARASHPISVGLFGLHRQGSPVADIADASSVLDSEFLSRDSYSGLLLLLFDFRLLFGLPDEDFLLGGPCRRWWLHGNFDFGSSSASRGSGLF